MRTWLRGALAAGLLLIGLTGCATAQLSFTVHRNGTVDSRLRVLMDPLLLSTPNAKTNLELVMGRCHVLGYHVQPLYEGNQVGFECQKTLRGPGTFLWYGTNVVHPPHVLTVQSAGFWTTYHLHAPVAIPTSGSPLLDQGLQAQVILHAPVPIHATGGSLSADDRTVTWTLTPDTTQTLDATFTIIHWRRIAAVAAGCFLIGLGGGWMEQRRRRRRLSAASGGAPPRPDIAQPDAADPR